MRGALVVIAAACGAWLVACESETREPDRPSTAAAPQDAGTDGDALAPGEPDPKDGRDEDPASCYAACSNTAFSCQAGDVATHANLNPDASGCSGLLTTGRGTAEEKGFAMKLDCGAKTVCLADTPDGPATTCVSGSFSAFSFSYKPASGGENVCIRD